MKMSSAAITDEEIEKLIIEELNALNEDDLTADSGNDDDDDVDNAFDKKDIENDIFGQSFSNFLSIINHYNTKAENLVTQAQDSLSKVEMKNFDDLLQKKLEENLESEDKSNVMLTHNKVMEDLKSNDEDEKIKDRELGMNTNEVIEEIKDIEAKAQQELDELRKMQYRIEAEQIMKEEIDKKNQIEFLQIMSKRKTLREKNMKGENLKSDEKDVFRGQEIIDEECKMIQSIDNDMKEKLTEIDSELLKEKEFLQQLQLEKARNEKEMIFNAALKIQRLFKGYCARKIFQPHLLDMKKKRQQEKLEQLKKEIEQKQLEEKMKQDELKLKQQKEIEEKEKIQKERMEKYERQKAEIKKKLENSKEETTKTFIKISENDDENKIVMKDHDEVNTIRNDKGSSTNCLVEGKKKEMSKDNNNHETSEKVSTSHNNKNVSTLHYKKNVSTSDDKMNVSTLHDRKNVSTLDDKKRQSEDFKSSETIENKLIKEKKKKVRTDYDHSEINNSTPNSIVETHQKSDFHTSSKSESENKLLENTCTRDSMADSHLSVTQNINDYDSKKEKLSDESFKQDFQTVESDNISNKTNCDKENIKTALLLHISNDKEKHEKKVNSSECVPTNQKFITKIETLNSELDNHDECNNIRFVNKPISNSGRTSDESEQCCTKQISPKEFPSPHTTSTAMESCEKYTTNVKDIAVEDICYNNKNGTFSTNEPLSENLLKEIMAEVLDLYEKWKNIDVSKREMASRKIVIQKKSVQLRKKKTNFRAKENISNHVDDMNFQDKSSYLIVTEENRNLLDSLSSHHQNCKSLVIHKTHIENLNSQHLPENVQEIYILDTSLTSFYIDLQNLSILTVQRNHLKDLTGLVNAPNLLSLNVSYNEITRLNGIEHCTKLIYLNVDNNQLLSLKCLQNLTNLSVLSCQNNLISSVDCMQYMPCLLHLSLNGNNFSKFPNFHCCPLLMEVHIDDNNLSKVDFTSCFLPNLKYLSVARNSLLEFVKIETAFSLKTLDISENLIVNVKEIEKLKFCLSLEKIVFNGNPVFEVEETREIVEDMLLGMKSLDKMSHFYPVLKISLQFQEKFIPLRQDLLDTFTGNITQAKDFSADNDDCDVIAKLKVQLLEKVRKDCLYQLEVYRTIYENSHEKSDIISDTAFISSQQSYTDRSISCFLNTDKDEQMHVETSPVVETLRSEQVNCDVELKEEFHTENRRHIMKGNNIVHENSSILNAQEIVTSNISGLNKFPKSSIRNDDQEMIGVDEDDRDSLNIGNITSNTSSHSNIVSVDHSTNLDRKSSKSNNLVSDASSHPGIVSDDSNHPEIVSDSSSHPEIVSDASSHPEIVSDHSSHPGIVSDASSHPEIVSDNSSHPEIVSDDSSHPEIVSDDSSEFDYDAVVDTSEFDFDEESLNWRVEEKPNIRSSGPPVPNIVRVSPFNRKVRNAWKPQTPPRSPSDVSIPILDFTNSSANSLYDGGDRKSNISSRKEAITEEWGFTNSNTTELMMKRAKKLKTGNGKKMLDSKRRFELFKKHLAQTSPVIVHPPTKRTNERLSYFQAAVKSPDPVEYENEHSNLMTYSWVCNQTILHEDNDVINQDVTHDSELKRNDRPTLVLPKLDENILSGRKVSLVQSEVHNPKPPEKSRSSSGPARRKTTVASLSSETSHSAPVQHMRKSSRDGKGDMETKWKQFAYR